MASREIVHESPHTSPIDFVKGEAVKDSAAGRGSPETLRHYKGDKPMTAVQGACGDRLIELWCHVHYGVVTSIDK
jgi:hypothetical protein